MGNRKGEVYGSLACSACVLDGAFGSVLAEKSLCATLSVFGGFLFILCLLLVFAPCVFRGGSFGSNWRSGGNLIWGFCGGERDLR